MGRQQPPRQRPISCALCRVRKLRCSRVFPCSNCTSRGVVCQHDGAPHVSLGGISKDAVGSGSAGAGAGAKDLHAVDLLSRLERLEALVASQAKTAAAAAAPEPPRQAAYPEPSQPVTLSSSAVPSRLQRLTADALWLEKSCSGQKLLVSARPLARSIQSPAIRVSRPWDPCLP